MPIPDSFLDELVGRTDILELVGGYVQLTKRSGSNMFGLCPFHSEKTPSFSVNADKQVYHCFGCGKGGSVINFIMEIENLSFRDAVEFMARRAGLSVPESGTADELAHKRRRILELNREAARYFYEMLISQAGVVARNYLAGRRVSKSMVTRFGIGAAPDSWTMLLDSMSNKGYSRQELIEAGLARSGRKEGGAYDLFRNRLMFPVIDVRGGVIGFSGRILSDGEPKYLNSPDTLVFSKSRNLFALNLAKKTKSGMLILAEGNLDVVALHQAGFDCAVASLGTALTPDQARLISRYADKVAIAYDSDKAGRGAALRAIPLLEKTGVSIKVIDMGDSKDPDEYLKKHSPDAFKVLLERSDNHIEYRLMTIETGADLSSNEGRLRYLAAATEMLAQLESKPEREIYGARVAKTAGVSAESVENEVDKRIKTIWVRQKKEQDKRVMRPVAAAQPPDRALRYENEYSAVAEEGLIVSLVRDPTLMKAVTESGFLQDEFTSPFLAKVFKALSRRVSEDRDTRAALILSELEKHEASQLTTILQKSEALLQDENTVRDYINKIRAEKYKKNDPNSSLLMEIKSYREKKEAGGH